MQCLLSIMSHLVGVPEIYPKVLIIGGSGRCGQGAAYILEKTGIPRLIFFFNETDNVFPQDFSFNLLTPKI